MDEVSGAKRKELLREHRELALLSKKLASSERDVPIDVDAAAVLPHQPQRDKLEELFTRFEFHTLLERVEPLLPDQGLTEQILEEQSLEGRGPGRAVGCHGLSPLYSDAGRSGRPGGPPRSVAPAGVGGRRWRTRSWLAQAGADRASDDYAAYTVVRIDGAGEAETILRPLLAQGSESVMTSKAAETLHQLMDRAGHDTYLAAYLLARDAGDTNWRTLRARLGLPFPRGRRL